MKVLHIGKYFSPFKGGVETYMLDAMTALNAIGVDCAAVVNNHELSIFSSRETMDAGRGSFDVYRAGTWFKAFFTAFSPAFGFQLRKAIKTFGPDIIHVHLPNPSACWLLLLGRYARVPLVIHWHSDVITSELGQVMKGLYGLYKPLENMLLKRAGAIIATSDSYLASSESLQRYPDKCHVVPLGLDPARFALDGDAVPIGLDSDHPFQILAIGRLTYYKGFGYLLEAAARMKDIQVHLVGTGELEDELRSLARQLQLGDRIHFHGAIDDEGLVDLFRQCHCLCLPSIEKSEAFGLVLLEAMYFSRATVASRVAGSGMEWVVQDGVTGLQVPPRDPASLARALERLRDDRPFCHELGVNGRRRFDKEFSIAGSARSLKHVYGQLAPVSGEAP